MFFNRDEQRLRASAIAPRYDEISSAIYPIDPQGKGTWLAVSNRGVTLALLNNYQASLLALNSAKLKHQITDNKGIEYISRGKLITSILQHQPLHSAKGADETHMVESFLNNLSLENYQPFTLCVFSSALNEAKLKEQLNEESNQKSHQATSKQKELVKVLQWNGEQLSSENINNMLTSSGKNIDIVTKDRQEEYARTINQHEPSSQQYINFHLKPTSPLTSSVNMSREDARTVSFSHITVNENINFKYIDLVKGAEFNITTNKICQ